MSLKIKLYTRHFPTPEENDAEITSGNVIINGKFYNYTYDSHKDYERFAIANNHTVITNTRFSLVNGQTLFARLGWWQKIKLDWWRGETFIQKKFWQFGPFIVSVVAVLISLLPYFIESNLEKDLKLSTKRLDSLLVRVKGLESKVEQGKPGR